MRAASGVPDLGGVRERRLVAVVAVGDQELLVGEERRKRAVVVEPPQRRALGGEIRRPLGRRERRLAVVEQEDRLELDAGRAEQPQTPFLGPGVRALVRQHDLRLVRLDAQRGDDALAPSRDAVRGRRTPAVAPRRTAAPPRARRRRARRRGRVPPSPRSPAASAAPRCTGCVRPAPRAARRRSRRRAARRAGRAARPRPRRSAGPETAARRPSRRAYQRPSGLDSSGGDDRRARA